METMNAVASVVASLGFPIVMCGGMGWFVKYMYDKHREDKSISDAEHHKEVEDLTTSFSTQLDAVTEALNNNTIALTKLCERLNIELGRKGDN